LKTPERIPHVRPDQPSSPPLPGNSSYWGRSGKWDHRIILGVGHNLPQEAPKPLLPLWWTLRQISPSKSIIHIHQLRESSQVGDSLLNPRKKGSLMSKENKLHRRSFLGTAAA